MTDIFDPGDRIKLTRTFTAIEGTISSVTITCTLQDPSGAETAVSPINTVIATPSATGTGFHTVPALNTSHGWWYARWVASGDIVATEEAAFYVRRSAVLA